MLKTIIEKIKTNKRSIVKKALIVGGTIAGLVIVGNMLRPKENEENEDQCEVLELEGTVVENESNDETPENEL